jgi:hypothetical protein
MKFPNTINRIKQITAIHTKSTIEEAKLFSDEYSRDDIIQLSNELRDSGLRWDKLLRVRKEPKEELKARYENS